MPSTFRRVDFISHRPPRRNEDPESFPAWSFQQRPCTCYEGLVRHFGNLSSASRIKSAIESHISESASTLQAVPLTHSSTFVVGVVYSFFDLILENSRVITLNPLFADHKLRFAITSRRLKNSRNNRCAAKSVTRNSESTGYQSPAAAAALAILLRKALGESVSASTATAKKHEIRPWPSIPYCCLISRTTKKPL